MAIYRVLLDGVDIYDPTSKGMVLIDPVVHTEAGAAGNFEFTMPPKHVFYNSITPYGSSIEVLEDEESIFYGRPLKPKIGFYNQKTYHCEGALAFLNDSRPTNEFSFEDITPAWYFRDLISRHNALQSNPNRQFVVGNITVSVDWDVYREMSPSMTILEHIKRGCIGSDGGYLFTRRANGVNYIDWVKDMPYTCNQTVEFALNLLDMSRSGNEDIYTGVMLKGGERRVKKNGKTSNSIVRYGPKWGTAEVIAKYGEILGYQEYPDITNVNDLKAAGDVFLMTQQFESMIFEVTAAEQHYLNASLDMFRAGQKVHFVSNPHFVDIMIPVQSVEVRLDSAEKKVVLGTQKRQTLTKIQRKTQEEQNEKDQKIDDLTDALDIVENNIDDINNNIDDIIDNQGTILGDDGNRYVVGVDENGNVYATKIPSALRIEQLPEKLSYANGDTYDWTGLVVMAWYGDGTEADVTSECTISPADGSTVDKENGSYQAVISYIINDKYGLEDDFYYTVGAISAIHIVIKPRKLEYAPGETIDFTGIHVYLLGDDGTVYKDSKYPTGEIPFEELIFPVTVAPSTTHMSSDFDLSPLTQPLLCEYGGWSAIKEEEEKVYTGDGFESCVGISYGNESGGGFEFICASKNQTDVINWNDGYRTRIIKLTNTYVHNGKTVYYMSTNFPKTGYVIEPHTANVPNHDVIKNLRVQIAWTIIYGDSSGGSNNIPVQWKRADDVILEDTFEVRITMADDSEPDDSEPDDGE